MDNAPEGERLKLSFTMAVENFISKYSQHCQSSLIPDMKASFLRAKGNPFLVYFAPFVYSVLQNRDIMEMINSANLCPQNFYAEKQAPEVYPLVEKGIQCHGSNTKFHCLMVQTLPGSAMSNISCWNKQELTRRFNEQSHFFKETFSAI